MYYTPKNFSIDEFIPKEIAKRVDINKFWFVRPEVLITADLIRDRYEKPLFINTWMFAGMPGFSYRGFRPANCNVGAELSQHKLGNAIDFNIEGISAAEIQQDIRNNPYCSAFKYITCLEIELALEKTHIDFRPHDKAKSGLLIIKKEK